MTWLGEKAGNHWEREHFPEGMLNAAQMQLLFHIEDKGRRVVELDLHPNLYNLTDDGIVKIHVRFGSRRNDSAQRVVFWLDAKGAPLASCEEFWDQPKRPVKAYLKRPSDGPFAKAEERDYPDGLWSLGNYGAIPEIRQFVRETWTDTTDDIKEEQHA